MATKGKKAKCMVPNCQREAKTRGVCGSCYTAARFLVINGKTTWCKLEQMGLVASKPEIVKRSPMMVAFDKQMAAPARIAKGTRRRVG